MNRRRWDEVGDYDIPAIIEYILKITGQPKLTYVGHSLGAAWFFIAAINHPELNDKIEMMIALAPFASSVYYPTHYPLILKNIDAIEVKYINNKFSFIQLDDHSIHRHI